MAARVINSEQLSEMLGITISAIYSHIARKNYASIPPPVKFGRRLGWIEEDVEQWINNKRNSGKHHIESIDASDVKKKIGRPTKKEEVAMRKKQ